MFNHKLVVTNLDPGIFYKVFFQPQRIPVLLLIEVLVDSQSSSTVVGVDDATTSSIEAATYVAEALQTGLFT